MPQEHTYELVSSHLATWIDETAKSLADGMREGGRAPFAASTTESQKLHYYEAQLFNPDGTPNGVGRSALQERLGEPGYYSALAQVTQARQGRTGGAGAMGPDITEGESQ